MDLIDKHIISRSTSAIRCLPLNSDFYKDIQISGLSAEQVFNLKGRYIAKKFFKLKNAEEVEIHFLWLIKIGVLRREVDGQGLTSKVRLTPLGRLVLENDQNLPNQKASLFELVKHSLYRFFLFP